MLGVDFRRTNERAARTRCLIAAAGRNEAVCFLKSSTQPRDTSVHTNTRLILQRCSSKDVPCGVKQTVLCPQTKCVAQDTASNTATHQHKRYSHRTTLQTDLSAQEFVLITQNPCVRNSSRTTNDLCIAKACFVYHCSQLVVCCACGGHLHLWKWCIT